jgi:nicotinamidase/pyrazinamidase
MSMVLADTDVLLVVDIQKDFCPGGRLAVPHGDEVVPLINRLAAKFTNVVLTQDWHPAGHLSFASSHPGKQPYQTIEVAYGAQVLWPDHCVQNTPGAVFRDDLQIPHAALVIRRVFTARSTRIPLFMRTTARHRPGLPATCASAA